MGQEPKRDKANQPFSNWPIQTFEV